MTVSSLSVRLHALGASFAFREAVAFLPIKKSLGTIPCSFNSRMRALVFFWTKLLYAPQRPRFEFTMRMPTLFTFSGTRNMGSSCSRPLPFNFLTKPLIMPCNSSLKGRDLTTPSWAFRTLAAATRRIASVNLPVF